MTTAELIALSTLALVALTALVLVFGKHFRIYRRLRGGFWKKYSIYCIGPECMEIGGWVRYRDVVAAESDTYYTNNGCTELAVEDYTPDNYLP